MRRSNTFIVTFKNPDVVMDRAIGCATLWNEITYRRRQSFFNGEIDWTWKDLYDKYKGWFGSSSAETVIRKNSEAWRGFFSLLKLKAEGKLPPNIAKVRPPGYWKDGNTGKLKLIYVVRDQAYTIRDREITFPFKLKGKIKGNIRWSGKQGRLELIYDRSKKCWYAHQSVTVEPIQFNGHAKAYVDLGVRYPITAIIEGRNKPIAWSGNEMLSDWWYWNMRIAKYQSELKEVNNRNKSKRQSGFYRTRTKRHRDAVNKLVYGFIRECRIYDVGEIIAGDLTGIRNNGSKGKKTNTMISNFWGHKYLVDRLRFTAENEGIKVTLINERGTSSVCPWCNSKEAIKRGRMFKCKNCGIEAHRDVVGALNIGLVHGNLREGDINRVMAHPEVVKDFFPFHVNQPPNSHEGR